MNTNALIGDLAWILLLGSIVTLLFKKLKQPVVLGYILAGFLASPKFTYLPSISNLENIEFWAELGIVILMFCLGLEFSFKKLLNSGSSAIVTALIIITGMTLAGFGVGCLLHLNTINCIFLGGMISMSSTTIILKSLTDLGLRQNKFATMVLSVLIIEDLFAVLMLVLLSSLAMGDVKGMELLFSVGKLLFFLIIWFIVGVYVIPSMLVRLKGYLNNETLLVVSMALCFAMAVFSVSCGFSLELGAFVMGSILAGTMAAERIEHVVVPVKDLFGSVFFISVGMMVDPVVLATYWGEILILAVVVIVGMIIFGTLGMLVTGQSLKVAMESGFTLTQIGEFSFIIASLGMSLGVLEPSLYPIIVAVSVITIFTTPYFIKMAKPAYNLVLPRLPKGLHFLIDRYSKQTADSSETKRLWREILGRYMWRIVLYSVILLAIILVSREYFFPFMEGMFHEWGHLAATVLTLVAMSPFLVALSFSSTKPDERMKLHQTASFYDVPLVAMRIVRYVVAMMFTVYFVTLSYRPVVGWIVGVCFFMLILIFASSKLMSRYKKMEDRFMDNLNIRENTRSGRNNNLVDDLHQAYIQVGPNSIFVGDRLKDSGLRHDYGVSVSSIQRGQMMIPLPGGDTRIFPGDILGVIGNDEQIKALNDDIERDEQNFSERIVPFKHVELRSILLTPNSPIVDVPLRDTNIRDDFRSMLIKVHRNGDYFEPRPDTILRPGDVIWAVGDADYLPRMK
ncbi:sodium:proton antiporter [bacterium]|nr:sodium:proton antiporter [Bacteroidales bacterium]MBD5292964.1 sodium:proton antiporter [Bacteroides sp.]MBD5337979.1 sodium:proton antiporter [Bacteroides sp.]MBD5385181.1 sodium:proton antiporter [bacterium]MDE7509456.1 cation:proton antiporter [Muribaculaceae bacterium]